MYNRSDSVFSLVLKLVGIFLLLCLITYGSQSCSRSEHNMIKIKSGYCYEEDTKIIYLESESGRYGTETVYTPYYSKSGGLFRYDETNGEWIEIDGGE